MSLDKNKDMQKELECFKAELSDADFKIFSDFIYTQYGIKMPPIKKVMLQGRLLKRIRELGMKSYTEYKNYFFGKEGQERELYNFLNVVTTNKTDFFREPVHFDFLRNSVIPEFVSHKLGGQQFKVWSAGCSSGEELYTISLVLNEYKRENIGFNYSILGTDISHNVMGIAAKGIYSDKKIETVSLDLKKRYFLKSKDRDNPTIKVRPELQNNVSLKYLNLMDSVYDIKEMYNVIFCRNVMIYFDRPTQEAVINKLCRNLEPGGYFFIGHSESLSGMDVPLQHIKPTIFRKV
ncbi:MAG: chemotaxis protein CheR [Breznakibacter sp.]|nr:chemotaxis protein CheR [Breznakibacter sp.]